MFCLTHKYKYRYGKSTVVYRLNTHKVHLDGSPGPK